jgi:hypothetical protein
VTGDWIKLHNEELRNLYSSTNISRMINKEGCFSYFSRRRHLSKNEIKS